MKIYNKLDIRTKTLISNIGLTSIYRFGGIILSFLSVPLLINYLGTDTYGLWITLSSILVWINFFDLGISLSLQNKISQTIALGKIKETKIIISTTYFIISAITISVLLVITILILKVDWASFFNSNEIIAINKSLIIISISISLQIILRLITAVFFAYQKTGLNEFLSFINQLCIYIFLLIVINFGNRNEKLFTTAIISSIIPVIFFTCVNIIAYKKYYKNIAPSFRYFKKSKIKNILSQSSNFFILQLYGMVLFQTDNIIVANLYTPNNVTLFSLITKYYNILTILFGLLILPYWSAISQAFAVNDVQWIIKSQKKGLILWLLTIPLCIIMVISIEPIIYLWTKKRFDVPLQLSITTAIYTLILGYNNLQGILLNAANKFRVQIIIVIVIIVINIPLAYYFAKILNLGITGIVLSNLSCIIMYGIFSTIQVHKILSGKAMGVWLK